MIRVRIHNICIKLIFFFPLEYQGEEIMIVLCMFGLVFKQVSTDKWWLNLNSFMGLFQSCGLSRTTRRNESILTSRLCLSNTDL